ncbi:Aorsin [Orbilia brochopaga]|nr:Aorsin [Drechslerella brochopaga]
MHFSRLLVVVPALLVGVYAIPFTSYQQFESLPSIPQGWEIVSGRTVDPSTPIKLRIHLVKQNVEAFRRAVVDLSTPGHPSYGNHMSQRSIDEMLRPREENFAAVKEWLASQGLADKATLNNDWIMVSTTVGEAESLLHTKYQVFQDTKSGDKAVRALSYSLPRELHSSISFVQPTTMFGRVSAMRSTIVRVEDPSILRTDGSNVEDPDAAGCATSITPKCLSDLYKYTDYNINSASTCEGATPADWTNQIGINGFLEQYAQNDDLSKFLKKYALKPEHTNRTFTCHSINSGLCTQHPSEDFTEANLDIQYTVSGTENIPNTYYSTAGRPPAQDLDPNTNEPYLDWVHEILKLSNADLPQTITTSYGDDEHTVPQSYATEVCDQFATLGARGVTLLFSSGDSGPGSNCQRNGKKQFIPTFPATCPFITSVGGTFGVSPEKAVGFSSGGFSNYFPRPTYQDEAVGAFLAAKGDAQQFAQYFNATGRGFPDVAAQGQQFHVYVSGFDQLVSGTSASSPAFAAVIALWNSIRVKDGKRPLGFLNPLIYSTGKNVFTDIVAGTSRGCTGTITGAGWKAVAGWDPVTGLGTPNFQNILKLESDSCSSGGQKYYA